MRRWLRFGDWSLRRKLIALLVIASAVPLAVSAVLEIRDEHARSRLAAGDVLSARADELVGKLDIFNDNYRQTAARLARLPMAIEAALGRAAGDLQAVLQVRLHDDAALRGSALLDAAGIVKLATEASLVGRDLSQRSYIREPLHGNATISDVHVSERELGDVPTIAFAAPIHDATRVVGVVVMFVRAAGLWKVMHASNGLAGEGSFAVMFDRTGIRIGHTYNRDIVFHPGAPLDPALVEALVAERRFGDDTRRLVSDPRVFREQFDRARAEVPDRELFRGHAPVNSLWNVGVARRLGSVPWTVFYMLPETTIDAKLAALTRSRALFAGIVIVLALVVGILLARAIARPVHALEAATRALASGDRAARVLHPGTDELGALGASFNAMADQIGHQAAALEAARDELEARVQQRTTELVESEQRLATTLLSIGDAVIATDIECRITRMNPVAEALTGWPTASALGKPLAEVFRIQNERTGETVESPADRVLREGVIVGLANHTILVARDGTTRPIADSGAPIRDATGAVHGVVLVFRDVTAEHAGEASRLRAIELAAENRRVEEASRLKSEFLANMSHELRTPLNSIIGFGELLRDEEVGELSADQREFTSNIVTSGRHLLQLINDVLDLSKVEAGKMEFRPEPVSPAALLAEVVGILRTTAATSRVRLATAVDPALGEIVIDPARAKQILYNYLSNALKFTPADGTVEARIFAVDPDRFRIEVEDTGVGIPAVDLSRLFVEFQQLDSGAGKQHAGTGLGLALTRRLVEAQGGEVGVTSVVGRGSIFSATLPRRAPTAVRAETPSPVSRRSVLVVEDDHADRGALAGSLTAAGYVVDLATSVASAIAKCMEREYLAITLDLLLPDGSGLDVLAAIRARGPNRDVKVIVVTVVAEAGAVAGFVVDDILAKPLRPAALVDALRRAGVPPTASGAVWVIDDDPGSCALMVATLEQLGFHATAYLDAAAAMQLLDTCTPIAVVVDLLMPVMDGFAVIDRLRAHEACRSIPIIVWTVKDLTDADHARLRGTAQAVLAKGSGAGAGVVTVLRGLLTQLEESHG